MNMSSVLTSLPFTLVRLTGLRKVADDSGVTVHRLGRYHRVLGPGWHWTMPGIERLGRPVRLIGHHVDVSAPTGTRADLYYQILDPARAGAVLDQVDQLVQQQARDALAALPPPAEPDRSPAEALKAELNRRVARHGLRVIRCSLA
jgi:hypothetical protein